MMDLTKEEKDTLKNIINNIDYGILIGQYDAKNGSREFMNGIATAMEFFAYSVSEDFGSNFERNFFKNILDSNMKI